MKIKVTSYDDSDDDCIRTTFVTVVDGKEHCLSACALGTPTEEIEERARTLFGADVEISYDF